jgi:hypothetical protein
MSDTERSQDAPIGRRRFLRFGLAAFLLVVAAAGIGLGIFGRELLQVTGQKKAVQAVNAKGGIIRYDYEAGQAPVPKPGRIRSLVGKDWTADVTLVNLSEKEVADADLAELTGLKGLRILGLRGTHITDEGLEHLKELTELTFLSLAETRVTDAGLAHLSGLLRLRKLNLDDTGVTDAGLEHLKSLVDLEEVSVRRTRVTFAGAKRLRKSLPNCTAPPYFNAESSVSDPF